MRSRHDLNSFSLKRLDKPSGDKIEQHSKISPSSSQLTPRNKIEFLERSVDAQKSKTQKKTQITSRELNHTILLKNVIKSRTTVEEKPGYVVYGWSTTTTFQELSEEGQGGGRVSSAAVEKEVDLHVE